MFTKIHKLLKTSSIDVQLKNRISNEFEKINMYISDIEFSNIELSLIKNDLEYYVKLSEIFDFIKEKPSIMLFYKYGIKPLDSDFITFFLNQEKKLKRLLNFDEILTLNQKFILTCIKKTDIKTLKELHYVKL